MYFITTLRVLDTIVDDCRTVGYFKNYVDAFDKVKNNSCDIFECGYYNYAVITFVEEGLYPNKPEQQWFKYEKDKDEIYIIKEYHKRPDELEKYNLYIIG